MKLFRSILRRGSTVKETKLDNDLDEETGGQIVPASADSTTVDAFPSILEEYECCFSDDLVGQNLLLMWNSYKTTQNDGVVHDKFLSQFIEDFSTVILHQSVTKYKSQSITAVSHPSVSYDRGDGSGPCVINCQTANDTVGHPSELLVDLANLTLDYVEVSDSDKSLDSILNKKFCSIQIKTSRLFCETAETSEKDSGSSTNSSCAEERLKFMNIFHGFSLICFWPRNVATLKSKVGRNIIQVYLDIVRCFLDKLDELSESCNGSDDLSSSYVLDSVEFVLNVLNAGVHFLSYSSPSVSDVVQLTQFGLTTDFSWKVKGESHSAFDSCQHFLPRHCHANDIIPKSFVKMPHYSMTFPTNVDSFCGELTHIGADDFLISILMKTTNVSCWLNSCMMKHSSKPLSKALLSNVSSALVSCLTLEVESLFSILCLMTAQPLAPMVDLWSSHCVPILRSFHMPTTSTGLNRLDFIIRDIILQRGLMCLSINGIFSTLCGAATIRGRTHSEPNMNKFSSVDTISFQYESMLFDSVLLLCSWINNNDYRLYNTVILVSDQSICPLAWFQNVSVSYTCPLYLVAPTLACDLWPWNAVDTAADTKQHNIYRLCDLCSDNVPLDKMDVLSMRATDIIVDNKEVDSFFYCKSCPIFRIANRDESFCAPSWLRNNSTGFSSAWSYLFDHVLNLCSDHNKTGSSAENFDTIFTAITHAVRSSLTNFFDNSSFPLLQMHFLIFLIQCFKLNPLELVSIYRQHDIIDLLLGEYFMKGGRAEVSKYLGECKFDCKVGEDASATFCSNSPSTSGASSEDAQSCVAYSWIFLHDSIFDLIRCTIGVSFNYVDDSGAGIINDINLLVDTIAGDKNPSDDYVLQVVSLLSFAYDNIGHGLQFSEICTKSFLSCIELSTVQLDCLTIDSSSLVLPDVKEVMERVTKQRPLLWAARAAVLQLIVKLMDILTPTPWLTLLLNVPPRQLSVCSTSLVPQTEYEHVEQVPLPASPGRGRRNSDVESTRDSVFLPVSNRIINQLVRLLYDANCRETGVYILTRILTACASEIVELFVQSSSSFAKDRDKYSSGVTKRIFKLRQLACDVLRGLLVFVDLTQKQPAFCDSYTTSCLILKALTVILRTKKYNSIRSCLQELFRKNDSIAHLLDCLKKVTNETICQSTPGLNGACDDSNCACAALKEHKLTILRHGLSLLTAAMVGNAACKKEFCLIMSANYDRSSKVTSASDSSTSALLIHSRSSRYQKLKWIVIRAEKVFSLETFVIFIEMMLDKPCLNSRSFIHACNGDPSLVAAGLFVNSRFQPRIKNYHVLPFIVGIIPQCSIPMQICILNTLHNLICGQAALVNLATCTQSTPLLLDLVLELFPYISDELQMHATNLLQTIGRYSISVSQLKLIFRLMHDKGEYRPSYTNHLLDGIRGMLSNAKGPRQFFVFDGHNSGLQLPPIMRWPSEKAFSFSIWFRISLQSNVGNSSAPFSLQSSDNDFSENFAEHSPYLLCLRNSVGAGFEIFLRSSSDRPGQYNIVFQTVLENGDISSYCPEIAQLSVTDDDWHFLAVSVTNNTNVGFRRPGTISVLFDSNYVSDHVKFPFPAHAVLSSSNAQMISEPLIGECAPAFRTKNINSTMRGQIGAIYFFLDVLSAKIMLEIYALGPDYCYCFEPVSEPTASNLFDGVLASSVALAFNSAVCADQLFLDITPEKNAVKWKSWPQSSEVDPSIHPQAGCMHARRFEGTYRSSTQNIAMALDSLGGLKSIFPIFAHFDHPRQLPITMEEKTKSGEIALNRSLDAGISSSVFQLLLCLLDKSIESQRILDQLSVMSLVGYCMETVSPGHMSFTVLNTMTTMYDNLGWHPAGQNSVLEFLLGNFRLWVFTPVSVTMTLMNWLLQLASFNPQGMRKVLGVQHFMDALCLHYWYKNPSLCEGECCNFCVPAGDLTSDSETLGASLAKEMSVSAFAADHWTNPSITMSTGVRLSGIELKLIRQKLFNISYALMASNGSVPLPEDVESLIGYLLSVDCIESKLECLRFLVHLLNLPVSSHVASHIIIGFAFSQAIYPIVQLHSHPHPQIRMYSLLVLCGVVNAARRIKSFQPIPQASRYYKLFQSEVGNNTTATGPINTHSHADQEDTYLEEIVSRVSERNSDSSKKVDNSAASKLFHLMETNCMDALGFSRFEIGDVLTTVGEMLTQKLSMASCCDSSSDVAAECKIVSDALLLLLFSENSGHLAAKVEEMSPSLHQKAEFDPLSFTLTNTILSEDRQSEEKENSVLQKNFFASVFPTLIVFIRQAFFSAEERISVLVYLKSTIASNFEFCEKLMRLPSWQHELLLLICEENGRINDLAVGGKAREHHCCVVDLCTRFLCDILMQAINIGCPMSSFFPSETDFADDNYFIRALMKGERHLGAVVLRDTLSHVSVCRDAKNTGFDILTQMISSLQQDIDIDSPTPASALSVLEKNMFPAKRINLHLNIWLVASIIFEFIAVRNNSMSNFPFSTFLNIAEEAINLSAEQVFTVVLSLVNLLGTISDSAFNWQMALDDSLFVPNLHSSGLFSSTKMNHVAYLASDVDLVIRPMNITGTKLLEKSPAFNSSVINTPLSTAAGGVLWVLIRVATTIMINGISTPDENNRQSVASSTASQVLPKLRHIIDILQQKEDKDSHFESLYLVVRVCDFLRHTKLDISAAWVHEALDLVLDLSANYSSLIGELIMASYNKATTADTEVPVVIASPSPRQIRQRKVSALISSKFMRGSVSVDKKSTKSLDEASPVYDGADADNVADLLLGGLRFIVTLPPDVELTHELWSDAMAPVWEEANAREVAYLTARLNVPGSMGVQQLLSEKKVSKTNVDAHLMVRCETVRSNMYRVQCRWLTQSLHAYDTWRKRSLSKWSRIVEDLANERGPWGARTTAADRDVYWILDSVESNRRLRFKLLRNTLGSRHQIASKLQQGYRYNINTKQFERGDAVGPVENNGAAVTDHSALGLWKNLLKYQTKAGASDSKEEGDEASDSEDEASAAVVNAVVDNVPTDKVLFSSYVKIVSCSTTSSGGSTNGKLEITKHRISFARAFDVDTYSFNNKTKNEEFQWVCLSYPSTVWNVGEIRNIYQRFYQQRFTAIEIFFTNRTSVYINLFDVSIAKKCYYVIYQKMQPANMIPPMGRLPTTMIQKYTVPGGSSRNITQAWVNREVSNFDYLMHLNTIAGRSFNDMSQYPVFPWVIADYKSSHLNLRDPKNYRDLRYPMGSQNAAQRQHFVEKYDDLQSSFEYAQQMIANGDEDFDALPPFHYGSHYSNMGFVLWYLIRLEPFTSLNIWLQDGRFDKPDRLFDSIEACWNNCTTSQADVKELIPEFFYFPEFLDNRNDLELGTKQTGETIGAVKLPPWARNSHDFVRINRDALESEYVSRHLHHWIDLIFGYKQRPPHMGGSQAAVNACNVFFHLTYTGAVDLEGLKSNDRPLYDRTVQQVDNFGQTPTELFRTKHPERLPLHKVDIIWPIASCVLGADTIQKGDPIPELPRNMVGFKTYQVSIHPVIFMQDIRLSERLLTLDSSRVMGVNMWQVRQPDVVPPYVLKLDSQAFRSSQRDSQLSMSSLLPAGNTNRCRRVGVPYSSHISLNAHCSFDHSTMPLRYVRPDGTSVVRSNRELFEDSELERNKNRMRAAHHMTKKKDDKSLTGSPSTKSEMSKGESRPSTSTTKEAFVASSSSLESPKSVKKDDSSSSRVDKDPVSQTDGSASGASTKASGASGVSSTPRQQQKPSRIINAISYQLFALLSESRLLFSCGHWDHSFKVTAADHTNKLIQSVRQHRDVVTCLAVASDVGQHWLVTGSRDCTVMVWEVFPDRDQPVSAQPLHVLYGHDDVVTTVSVNAEFDVVLSGSEDGTVIAHNLRDGSYLRSITVGRSLSSRTVADPSSGASTDKIARRPVHWICMSNDATVVMYSNDGHLLFSYNINGRLISIREAGERLLCFCLSEDGKVVVTGGERGLVVLRWTRSLDFAKDGPRAGMDYIMDGEQLDGALEPFGCPIRSICLSSQERHLLVGLESGHIRILAQNSDYLRRRLHHKLLEIGILSQSE